MNAEAVCKTIHSQRFRRASHFSDVDAAFNDRPKRTKFVIHATHDDNQTNQRTLDIRQPLKHRDENVRNECESEI